MSKSNAQKQMEYRERKKLADKDFLEKERRRQKKCYVPVEKLSKAEHKKRKEAVRARVKKSRDATKRIAQQVAEESQSDNLVVKFAFPNKGSASKKRRELAQKRKQRELQKLRMNNSHLKQKNNALRKRLQRQKEKLTKQSEKARTPFHLLTPKSKLNSSLSKHGFDPAKFPKDLHKQLLYADALSTEIAVANAKTSKKQSIRNIISGRILKKYRLLKYAAEKTGTNRMKLSKVHSKFLTVNKKSRETNKSLKNDVIEFYCRDDVSTALPGKRDSKKVKKSRFQKRTLNDFLSNLHGKFLGEYPNHQISLSTFARLRPPYCILANFTNRNSCLCTKHQNVALKLKMLKQKRVVETQNPDALIRSCTEEQLEDKFKLISEQTVRFEVWKKCTVQFQTKTGETRSVRKMKLVNEEVERELFISNFRKELAEFREHFYRIKTQYQGQRELKENLKKGHIAIHMDFSEDYRCRSQEEVQSAYWNSIAVSLHPVVVYYRIGDTLKVKSYVFISNETRHDAKFVYALLKILNPELKALIPDLSHCHYFTDSPTSQYRNKSIFKIISSHEEYFGSDATWNYSEAGHGKGPCDPIGGTAKRQADQAVRNGKVVIQDAFDFYAWASSICNSLITYKFLTSDDYNESQAFVTAITSNVCTIPGTMKLHSVKSNGPNKIKTRETSCYCQNCYNNSNLCEGWLEFDLRGNVLSEGIIACFNFVMIYFLCY